MATENQDETTEQCGGLSVENALLARFDAWWRGYWTPSNQPEIFDAAMKELARNAYVASAIAERRDIWNEIDSNITRGELSGNGFDDTAQRNGMILACNIVMDRINGN